MRHAVLALSLLILGCNMQGLPNGVAAGQSSNGDGGSTVGDGGTTVTADMSKPKGGEGANCKTACDCQDGLACFQSQCQMSMFGQVFCCESMDCPTNMFCQSGTTGMFQRCGMGGGGGGGGGGMSCGTIPCSSNGICTMMGCARCRMSTGMCSAM